MNATDAIAKALNDLLDQDKQFTNYDVTKYARSFTDDNVRHDDVIAKVSVEMNNQTDYDYVVDTTYIYNQGSVTPVTAVLYRPRGCYDAYDPDAIQTDKSLKQTAVASVASQVATAAASTASSVVSKFQNSGVATGVKQGVAAVVGAASGAGQSSVTSNSKLRSVVIDNRGRVCIPKSYLTRIGVNAGDVCYVHRSSVKGVVTIAAQRWSDKSHTYIGTYQSDQYGNVRIPSKALNACNVSKTKKGNDDYVTVRSETNHIVID